MKNFRKRLKKAACLFMAMLLSTGVMQALPIGARAADYEARIGEEYFDTLEEAFEAARDGDTITVLKDCAVSKTLEVTVDGLTLEGIDEAAPTVVSREADFAETMYNTEIKQALIAVDAGSLILKNLALDGGAVLDGEFNNTGDAWEGPLVYVKSGSCRITEGTVLQNNYSTSGSAGGVSLSGDGALDMDGALVQNNYSTGSGGGIYSTGNARVSITSGTVQNCYGESGSALALYSPAAVSGMTIRNNTGMTSVVTLCGEAVLSDCLIQENTVTLTSGTVYVSGNSEVVIDGCTITGNRAEYGSAVYISGYSRTADTIIKDCTITGNRANSVGYGSAVVYGRNAGLVLDGANIMEDNISADTWHWDIHYMDLSENPIRLGADFKGIKPVTITRKNGAQGIMLVDAATNQVSTEAEQFPWGGVIGRTVKKEDGNLYYEITYGIAYYANADGEEEPVKDAASYISEETAVVKGAEILAGREGYAFDHWNTSPDDTGTSYEAGQEITLTEDLKLYAQWKEAEIQEPDYFTVTFDTDGGTKIEPMRAVKGSAVLLPKTEKAGCIFLGWYAEPEAENLLGMAGSEMKVTTDMTVYAKWKQEEGEDKEIYTITFDARGGEASLSSVTAEKGDSISLPDAEREGFLLTGWYTEPEAETWVGEAGAGYTPEGDITLYAGWREKDAGNQNPGEGEDGEPEEKEPVIQTGYPSLFPFLYFLNACGILLVCLSRRKGGIG